MEVQKPRFLNQIPTLYTLPKKLEPDDKGSLKKKTVLFQGLLLDLPSLPLLQPEVPFRASMCTNTMIAYSQFNDGLRRLK